jgi:hypothetical protein
MELFGNKFNDLPGIDKDYKNKKPYQFRVGVKPEEKPQFDQLLLEHTEEEVEKMKYHIFGTNSVGIMDLFSVGVVFDNESFGINEKDLKNKLIEYSKSKEGYIITSHAMALWISNFPNFIVEKDESLTLGNTIRIGKLNNLTLYVGPQLENEDAKCAIVENNYWNYEIVEGVSTDGEEFTESYTLKIYMGEPDCLVFNINDIKFN